MKLYKLTLVCGVLLLVVASTSCNKLKARDQLNKGVGAYRKAQFQPAIMHFKNAVALDPSLLNARLYLATAYAQLYIPGAESPENLKIAQQAIDAFQDVLKMDPKNETAIASIAMIYYNMKKFDLAKEFQKRRMQLDPNNPEPYYWIGVLDWADCYPRRMDLRNELKLMVPVSPKRQDVLVPLPEKARAQLEQENGAMVEEGLKALLKAVDLRPNDSDAMAYLNLMYREKADLEKDPAAREEDLKLAGEWVDKALAIKKGIAEKAAAK